MKQITLIFMLMAFCFSATFASTVSTAPSVPNAGISTEKSKLSALQMKMVQKFQHKIAKISEKQAIKALGADSILDKDAKWWLRVWLLCWVAALIFSILGSFTVYGLWYVSYLLWTLGSIAAVIWLLKLLEVM